ncbi:hypothetical protein G9A89_021051 [Geosiphon pyriformis]|nr:hypothetical protein G9A89_021051 [Geosiphon pyriformis]
MALYTNARVGRIDIKLILDSGSAVDHAATTRIITADGNTKTPIEEIDNFSFEINGIQIPTKVLVMEATQYQALPMLLSTETPKNFNSCSTDSMPEHINATNYRDLSEKGKGRAEEESQLSLLGYVTLDQKNLFYQPPRLICVDCGKKLSTMGTCIGDNEEWPTTTKYYCRPCKWDHTPCLVCGEILPDERLWNDVSGRGGTCNEAYGYLHDDHEIWRMASAKAEGTMSEEIREIKDNSWTPEYTGLDYPKNDFFTDDPDEQRLANLNTKLCDHCLIPCHFQYCDECDLMFNLPPRILFPITELSKPKEEDTETEQYLAYPDLFKELELKWYSDNEEGICPKRAHDTDAGFNLRYPGQLPIIIAPHSLVKIDLKIVLEIPISTMIQVASQSSLAKKGIDIKGGIIDASYTGNIIVNQKIQDQALLFEASPEICSLANVANLYLLAKAHKHFKIPIHNLTEDVIEIPEETLVGSISTDSQNPEKLQFIPDFAQLFLFCDITSQI